jgi:hypothetical protein
MIQLFITLLLKYTIQNHYVEYSDSHGFDSWEAIRFDNCEFAHESPANRRKEVWSRHGLRDCQRQFECRYVCGDGTSARVCYHRHENRDIHCRTSSQQWCLRDSCYTSLT